MGNASTQQTIDAIRSAGQPLVIFGASIVGELLLRICRREQLAVDCFCDNDTHKTGQALGGIEVLDAKTLRTKYEDAVFLISAADIGDVIDQLHHQGYSKWFAGGLLLGDVDLAEGELSAPADFVEYTVGACITCHENYLNPDKVFLRSVDVIVTERCSLKCRDCANLMQYYSQPRNCDTEELLRSIDALCRCVDQINEFRVIGGEPFMNKDWHVAVKRCLNEPKVKRVVIYTNGTIIPRDEHVEVLKNDKVLVMATDYGALSKRIEGLIDMLAHHHIAYYRLKAGRWSDCSRIARHGRDPERQKAIFRACCVHNLTTLSDGKLYRCPFAANADRLGAVPTFAGELVVLPHAVEEPQDLAETRKRIRAFLLGKEYLEACDYCEGRSYGAPEIPPAVQTEKPLHYDRCDAENLGRSCPVENHAGKVGQGHVHK